MHKIMLRGRTFSFAAAAALTIAAIPARAEISNAPDPGWYIGAGAGGSFLAKSENTSQSPGTPAGAAGGILGAFLGGSTACTTLAGIPGIGTSLCAPGSAAVAAGTPITTSTGYRTGGAFAGKIGYLSAGGFRPELEFAYRSNDFESFNANGGSTNATGKMSNLSAMANFWYTALSKDSQWAPYIGVGFGESRIKVDKLAVAGVTVADGTKNVFSYQGGAGVGYFLSPKTELSVDYRYLVASDPTIPGPGAATKFKYHNQTAGLSIKFYFGRGLNGTNPACPNVPAGVALGADGCPLDSDGDGVPDYLDKCPGTPAGAKVDANGCELDSDGDGVPDSRDQCPETPKGVAVDTNGCPLDSDGDGVPDYLDKCPNTPKGVMVDANGCPAQDSDGDGVPDYLDKCPNTPKGIAVDANGCPLDSDGDGIPDYLDECPHTPAGAKILPNGCAPVGDCRRPRPGEEVDANGCALEKTFILRGVKFEFDSDRLTEDAKKILDGVAATLNNYPEISVELGGHTDNIGTDAYNLGLSERRSNSVKNYLTGKTVAANRMLPVGYGETQPIATNDSEEGREENRRVELKVLEQTQ